MSRTVVGILAASAVALASCTSSEDNSVVTIGVLLPLSGTDQLRFNQSLDWAVAEINQRGVRGRKLVLDYEDIGKIPADADAPERILTAARRFLDDPKVSAVIGTDYDDTTFKIAPAFIKAKKLLISPSATTAEITRAFGGKKYIWRTLESDVAQSEMMVLYAKNSGVARVAIATTTDLYGQTFFDWIPFYAEEVGIGVTNVLRMDPEADCSASMRALLAGQAPDLVYLVPGTYEQARCMVKQARAIAPSTRLMFSDGGQYDGLFEELGTDAEGIEGVSLEAYRDPANKDPAAESLFDAAFRARYGTEPPPYAANAFDSVALIAYALAQSNGKSGEALADALKAVVDSEGETANGEKTSGTGDGIRRALTLIEQGKIPDVSGATGDLRFDKSLGVDTTGTTYAVWQVKAGVQQWDEIQAGSQTLRFPDNYFTRDDRRSKYDTVAAEALQSAPSESEPVELPAREGLWAYIAAFSSGWENYRHQADAMNMYQILRARGVPDNRIILLLSDDLGQDPKNTERNVVRNISGGANLYHDMEIDYVLDNSITSENVLDILEGKRTKITPLVLDPTSNDDVFVFWVGHGGNQGTLVGNESQSTASVNGSFISPDQLSLRISSMAKSQRYRRMLVVLEACHGGVMGELFTAPNALLLTGASPHENSFGANFDVATSVWQADAFAWSFASQLTGPTEKTVTDVYKQAFLNVRGSHAKMYNAALFGPNRVKVDDFVTP